MRKIILICAIAAALSGMLMAEDKTETTTREIIALEREAMEGWQAGNPGPALANLDQDVTYFHYPLDKRLNGLAAVKEFFEPYRGKCLFDSYELLDPAVQINGDIALLSYQLMTHNGSVSGRWNCSEVFRHTKDGWKVIHAHWSKVNAPSA